MWEPWIRRCHFWSLRTKCLIIQYDMLMIWILILCFSSFPTMYFSPAGRKMSPKKYEVRSLKLSLKQSKVMFVSALLTIPSLCSCCREVARWATSSRTWRGRPPTPWWCRRSPRRRRRRRTMMTSQSYKSSKQELNIPATTGGGGLGKSCKERTKLYSTLLVNYRMLWGQVQKDAALPLGPPLLWENCGRWRGGGQGLPDV